MMLGNYFIIKKSTALMVAALAVGGCLLAKHYMKPGNNLADDAMNLKEDAGDMVRKGKRKAKEVADDVQDDIEDVKDGK